ncbi:MAG: hypothetical protein M3O36_17740, partial [Myxococcota bacterium]|nr:hypothetical protein [Myxococcota bacterium]
MTTASATSGSSWLADLTWDVVGRFVGRRTLAMAVASDARYSSPPSRSESIVRAVLDEHTIGRWAGGSTLEVQLTMAAGAAGLLGECSRCAQAFGPCVHVAILAIDLANSAELRDAVLSGGRTAGPAALAPVLRAARNVELRFDGALDAWLAPAAGGARVEIAASPFAEVDYPVGRAYGDRHEPASRALTVVVRLAGERKLLSGRDIAPPAVFATRDRRVLEHVRDRGSGRKAVHALGVDASLAIESMRAHGGVFALGFKGLLDFRPLPLRPLIVLGPSGSPGSERSTAGGAPFDALSAFWMAEDGGTRIPFSESAFFPGPFPYVWTRGGAIHRVCADVDLDMVRQLVQSPVLLVPAGKLKDAGARLLRATRGRGVAMPACEAFGLPPVETPRILLRLSGEPLRFEAQLVARYGTRELMLWPADEAAGGP